jgi:hypothetical protein
MKLRPLHGRILTRHTEPETKTARGIFYPEAVEESGEANHGFVAKRRLDCRSVRRHHQAMVAERPQTSTPATPSGGGDGHQHCGDDR